MAFGVRMDGMEMMGKKISKRGEIMLALLENVRDFAADSTALLEAFLVAGYGASSGRIWREADKISVRRSARKLEREEIAKLKRRFDAMMYKLEKDGLMIKTKTGSGGTFKITVKGKKKIDVLNEKRDQAPRTAYPYEKHGNLVIVAFDIPERERKKRNWLRMVLINFSFRMLQKSVWVGKIKIPAEFIRDLKESGLAHYVEIFEVGKSGTLREVI